MPSIPDASLCSAIQDDGVFVIEVFIPTFLMRLRDNQYVDAEAIEMNGVMDLCREGGRAVQEVA